MDFHHTTPGDAAALSSFLERVFHQRQAAPEGDTHWKYWSAHPDWTGSRSFTARRDGAIVAHAAAWPVRIRVPTRTIAALHAIDWAADPDYPGAGLWLLRKMGAMGRLMIATGGSEMTRRILPVAGFRPHGELWWFARPVRPLAQALTTTRKSLKLPARLLRNTFWRLSPPLSTPSGWSAARLAPELVPEHLWPRPSSAIAVTVRDAAFYRYVLGAPSARHVLFGLERHGELAGYFCLAFARHVARIADLWLPSATVEDWSAAFRTAATAAARERDVYEVSAWASTATAKAALTRAGFRLRDRSAVSVFGDVSLLEGRTLHVQMVDCDASFLSGDGVGYLT
jgi:GNAT acetyltransferase-like protein